MTHHTAVSIKSISDQGKFSGYAAIFNTPDIMGERIAPGAFKDALAKRNYTMPLLMSHDSAQPIGIFTKIQEDSKGLYVEGELNLDTRAGSEAYSLLKQGALTGLSIAFIADDYTLNKDRSRTITKATLVEISLTPIPAQSKAQVTSVRSLETDDTEDWGSILTALRGFVNRDGVLQ